jgi:hypothetical protein
MNELYIRDASTGNIFPASQSTFRIVEVATGGYKLSHFKAGINVAPDAAATDDVLGYIGKNGRFVAITEPA